MFLSLYSFSKFSLSTSTTSQLLCADNYTYICTEIFFSCRHTKIYCFLASSIRYLRTLLLSTCKKVNSRIHIFQCVSYLVSESILARKIRKAKNLDPSLIPIFALHIQHVILFISNLVGRRAMAGNVPIPSFTWVLLGLIWTDN